AAAEGRARLRDRRARLSRLQPLAVLVELRFDANSGGRRQAGARHVVVRQRVGLLEPHARHRRRHGQAALTDRHAMPTYRNIVVLTGAGLSAESGIATFRDKDGIWSRVDIEDVSHPDAFHATR